MKKYFNYFFLFAIVFIAFLVYFFSPNISNNNLATTTPSQKSSLPDQEVVADNLEIPWEIAFLPAGEILVTERPGRLLIIGKDKKIIEIKGVRHIGEGGLLGLALDPDYSQNNFIYLYLTTEENERLANHVERYELQNNELLNRKVILGGILAASNHDGGRIAFGSDGYLYVTTGDAQQTNLAQDKNSLNGKILRIDKNGKIPKDNPFNNAVFSYGHRNVQGLAWDEKDNLWATEHGRSGLQSGLDELNLIEKGKNYGWPIIQGDQSKNDMVSPIINSGSNETWAPSGAQYINSSIFFTGLRGATLYEAKIGDKKVTALNKHLKDEYGRLRTIKLGPDGYFYILTNNRDGRGIPKKDDDKIIRLNPGVLNQ